jgi:L-rhamnose-H+ transport protein
MGSAGPVAWQEGKTYKEYADDFFASSLRRGVFFYGLATVRMGVFMWASWVIHMSMLIFFSFIVGIIFREWRKVTRLTYATLIIALIVLLSSFVIMTWGSVKAEKSATANVEIIHNPDLAEQSSP